MYRISMTGRYIVTIMKSTMSYKIIAEGNGKIIEYFNKNASFN